MRVWEGLAASPVARRTRGRDAHPVPAAKPPAETGPPKRKATKRKENGQTRSGSEKAQKISEYDRGARTAPPVNVYLTLPQTSSAPSASSSSQPVTTAASAMFQPPPFPHHTHDCNEDHSSAAVPPSLASALEAIPYTYARQALPSATFPAAFPTVYAPQAQSAAFPPPYADPYAWNASGFGAPPAPVDAWHRHATHSAVIWCNEPRCMVASTARVPAIFTGSRLPF